jgi:hypothetical protein
VNEKIQKLAEQAGLDARTMGFETNQHQRDPWNARLTKFVELIQDYKSGYCSCCGAPDYFFGKGLNHTEECIWYEESYE